MKTIIHSFICCCLLASVAHCVELEVHPELRKRLSMWLGSRMRRDVEVEKIAESATFVRPEDIRDTLLPHSSTDINIRTKRSGPQSRPQGCSLATCAVHDLAHRLFELTNNKAKAGTAPATKLGPTGYGRRRRSLPGRQVTLRLEKGRLRPVWSTNISQVHKLEALLRRT
uniref:Adrenomedullin n=2 Tax=Nothobranchius TaxID=28779 RepID=A0A1A8RH87_9TELE